MKRHKVVIASLAILVIIMAGFLAYAYWPKNNGPIPADIRKELTFSPFVLSEEAKDVYATEYKFTTAEDNAKVLSYQLNLPDNTVTVSEYVQPPQFTEIPEYKERFLTNVAKQYATVQTVNGTIYLGRMELQNDQQLAVMIERGLLVFLSPQKEMDEAAWRNLGDQLEVQRVIN